MKGYSAALLAHLVVSDLLYYSHWATGELIGTCHPCTLRPVHSQASTTPTRCTLRPLWASTVHMTSAWLQYSLLVIDKGPAR